MNKMKEKSALKKYADLQGREVEEIKSTLEADGAFSEKEIEELTEILSKEKVIVTTVEKESKKKFKASELCRVETYVEDEITKKRIKNDNWRAFREIEKNLSGGKQYDFYRVRAIGVFENTLDENGNIVKVLKGIELKDNKPICKTRIMADNARLLNEQIHNSANNQANIYFLYADVIEF